MIKKIVLLLIAVVFSVSFFVLAFAGSTIASVRGGGAKTEPIRDVEALISALDAIENYGNLAEEERVSAAVLISGNSKTKATVYSYYEDDVPMAYEYKSEKRELAVYYGDDGIYYKSSGIISYEYDVVDEDDGEDDGSIMEFDVEAYVCADGCYIKVNEYIFADNLCSQKIRDAYKGEWTRVTVDVIGYLVDKEILTLSPIAEHRAMIDLLMSEELIDGNDTAVALDEVGLKEHFEESYPTEDYDVRFDFSIDFSEEDATKLHVFTKVTEADFWSSENSSRAESSLIVKDYCSTEVIFDAERLTLEAEDMDDFLDMFIIKERSGKSDD